MMKDDKDLELIKLNTPTAQISDEEIGTPSKKVKKSEENLEKMKSKFRIIKKNIHDLIGYYCPLYKNEILTTLSLLFAFIVYIITLRGCSTNAEMECVKEMIPLLLRYCCYMFFAGFIFAYNLYRIIKSRISRKFIYLIISLLLIIFLISRGTTFQRHGSHNKTFFFLVCLPLNFLFIYAFRSLACLTKDCKKIHYFIIFIVVALIYFYITRIYFIQSCSNWNIGIHNTHLINDEYCTLPQPEMCFHDLTNNWFDVSKLLKKDNCSNVINNLPITNSDSKWLAYPKTQFFSRKEKNTEFFQDTILDKMIPVQENEIDKSEYELFLNQEKHEIFIKLNRNESLIERSKQKTNERENNPLAKNVLSLFIDSISRQHFRRKLKKTLEWIEGFYDNKTSDFESYQFFKFHASGSHTTPNMMRAFYGTTYKKADKSIPLTEIYKNQGFITGKSSTFCSATYFEMSKSEKELIDIKLEEFDHENQALSCDLNYHKKDDEGPYGYLAGSYAMVKRCLYGKDINDYAFDYGRKFWETYKNESKFLELRILDAHEPSAELIQHLDDPIVNFLKQFQKEGLLEDTIIVIYADHGHHVNIFYYLFGLKDLEYETKLPSLFIILPRKAANLKGNNIKKWENTLIAAYDLHNFFIGITGSNVRNKFGDDILVMHDDKRGCKELVLPKDFCMCTNYIDKVNNSE